MSNGRRKHLTKTALRKAIRSGSDLAKVDRRTAAMKRLTAHVGAHVSDLGGHSAISHAERVLVQRAAMLTLLTEMVEEQIIRSNMQISERELQSYCGSTQQLTRILTVLGLQRRAKPVMSLDQYLRAKEEAKSNEEEETETEEDDE
jgi:hypothetical protein